MSLKSNHLKKNGCSSASVADIFDADALIETIFCILVEIVVATTFNQWAVLGSLSKLK